MRLVNWTHLMKDFQPKYLYFIMFTKILIHVQFSLILLNLNIAMFLLILYHLKTLCKLAYIY